MGHSELRNLHFGLSNIYFRNPRAGSPIKETMRKFETRKFRILCFFQWSSHLFCVFLSEGLPIRIRLTILDAWKTKSNPYKTYLMLSMKWVLNNSYLSFGQSQGDTYWKGLFIECRSDYQVGGLSCDNYQYPWFIMDAIILSSRISFVLAWILLTVSK